MKRNNVKILSLILALTLMIAMIPMAAMAEEITDHDHDCDCATVAAPAAVICTHPYMMLSSTVKYLKYDATLHIKNTIETYSCETCGYSYTETVESIKTNHTWKTAEDSYTISCIYCGYTK